MRKLYIFLLSLAVILLTSGCGKIVYNNDQLIAKNSDSFNLIKSKSYSDGHALTGSAELFEGMITVWKFHAKETIDVEITYKIKVSSGKAKLVLISPDNALTTLAEYTADSSREQTVTDTIQVEKGKNRMKLVADKDTKISYEFTVDKGQVNAGD